MLWWLTQAVAWCRYLSPLPVPLEAGEMLSLPLHVFALSIRHRVEPKAHLLSLLFMEAWTWHERRERGKRPASAVWDVYPRPLRPRFTDDSLLQPAAFQLRRALSN